MNLPKHYKFPHIEQFRNLITVLQHQYQNPIQTSDGWKFDTTIPLPIIRFYGTVKLHGTNAAIICDPIDDGKAWFLYSQSRERVLGPNSDNNGFNAFLASMNRENFIKTIPLSLREEAEKYDLPIKIFGEWCGKGIQSGVAVSQLPKMFVIFAVQVGERWCRPEEFNKLLLHEENIYNIYEIPAWEINVNFNDLIIENDQINYSISVLNLLDFLKKITYEVEQECPFAKFVGNVSGIGEGVVWRSVEVGLEGIPYMFKVKGEKHQNVKEKSSVELSPEMVNEISELVEKVVTEPRLRQGLEKLKEMGFDLSRKNTGHFLKWIQDDISRENKDILEISGLDVKKIMNEIQKSARNWFFTKAA